MVERSATRFADYLSRAMDVLRRDCPLHFAAARSALKGRSAAIRVGGEPALKVCLEEPPWVTRCEVSEIEVEVTPHDLAALLRGRVTLEEAVEDGRLCIRGELVHLTDFLDALQAWLHGALRCPALAEMHGAYLAGHESADCTKGTPP